MKKQVIIIHGGDVFDSYEAYLSDLKNSTLDFERMKFKGWKDTLGEKLGTDYDVILPMMPNKANAKYVEWKIWFEKMIPFFELEVILIGHSLGGIFLAKYLSENKFPKNIMATFLVAAPFSNEGADYSLADFIVYPPLNRFAEQSKKIYIYQSKDDPVVSFPNSDKYKALLPNAELCMFEDRQHFNQKEFPELIEEIKNL